MMDRNNILYIMGYMFGMSAIVLLYGLDVFINLYIVLLSIGIVLWISSFILFAVDKGLYLPKSDKKDDKIFRCCPYCHSFLVKEDEILELHKDLKKVIFGKCSDCRKEWTATMMSW